MSEEPIKHDQIIEKDVFKPAAESADLLLEKINLLISGIKELAKLTGKKIPLTDPKTIEEAEQHAVVLKKIIDLETGLTAAEKAQITQREIIKKQTRELRDELKSQGGLLGDLIIKKKQLQDGLLSAKTKDEIKVINQELFKTNAGIKNIKEGGTNAFNSWGNALTSFQFKFNALGSAIGNMVAGAFTGLISSIVTFGVEAAKSFFESAKGAGLFGQSVQDAKLNTEALQGALDAVEAQLARIGKSQKEIVADALDFGLGAKKLALEQALRDANRIQTAGLSDEDLKKVLDQRQSIQDQIVALDAEAELKKIKIKTDSIKTQVDVAKNGSDIELNNARTSLEKQLALLKSGKDTGGSIEDRLARVQELEKGIEDIEAESQKRRLDANKKFLDKKKKDDEKFAEDAKKAKEDSDKAALDALIKLTESEKDIAKKEQEAKDKAAEEEKKRIDDLRKFRKKALDDEAKERSAARKKGEDEANADRKKAIDEEVKRLNKKLELADKYVNAVDQGLQDSFDKERDLNDQKLSELDRQIQFQQQLALQGETNTLAELEKERAKALEEKSRIEKKAAKEKEALDLAAVFMEFLKIDIAKGGGKAGFSAGAEAIAQTFAAKGLTKLLAGSLFEGKEDIGKANRPLDSKGGRLYKLHDNESVVTGKGTLETPGLVTAVNKEGYAGAEAWAMKHIFPSIQPVSDQRRDVQVAQFLLTGIKDEIRKQTKAIENLPDIDFKKTVFGEWVETERRMGIINQTTYKKTASPYAKG